LLDFEGFVPVVVAGFLAAAEDWDLADPEEL